MTMAVPGALGANLWFVAVVLPLLVGRVGELQPVRGPLALVGLAAAPLGALALGLKRRHAGALLVVFPVLVVLPELALDDAGAQPPFALLGALLVGYLLAAAHALGRTDAAGDVAPLAAAPLPKMPTPPRWRRRLRMYRWLTALALFYPLALIAFANLWPPTRAAFAESFGPHAPRAQALVTAGLGLLWVGLYRAYLLGPLEGHLHHDRLVRQALEAARRHARRARPRPAFYIAVAGALGGMVLVLWLRHS